MTNTWEVIYVKSYKIEFELCEGDFEQAFGRKPTNESEFVEFCKYSEKGLRNGHIDWEILFGCARDEMNGI